MILFKTEHPQPRLISRSFLARCAAAHWGFDRLPPVALGEFGKPYFPDHPHHHFNLSHSGPHLVCALGRRPVGVDIQRDRPARPRLLKEVCSPAERQWLRDHGDSPAAFALLWAMKESRCKYTGRGLSRPISSISVPLPGEHDHLLELDGRYFSLRSGPGWQLSLCAEAPWTGDPITIKEEFEIYDPTGM